MSSNATSDAIHLGAFTGLVLAETVLAIVLQCSTLPLFVVFADYRSSTSYQMMFSIGLLDLLQLLPKFALPFLLSIDTNMPVPLKEILAAMNIVCWDALILQHLLLAANRAFILFRSHFRPAAIESQWERRLFRMSNAAIWLWALSFVVLFQTPLMAAKIDSENTMFFFDTSLAYSCLYQRIELPVSLASLGVSFCLYLSIVVLLKRNKAKTTANGGQSQNALLNSHERRILLQAVVLFSGLLSIQLVWYSFDYVGWLAQKLYPVYFTAYCAMNPVLYLTLLTQVRTRMRLTRNAFSEFRRRFIRFYTPRCVTAIHSSVAPMS